MEDVGGGASGMADAAGLSDESPAGAGPNKSLGVAPLHAASASAAKATTRRFIADESCISERHTVPRPGTFPPRK